MKLKEMKRIILGLIEELNEDSEYLTDDEDISAKINDAINMVQLELSRFKKLVSHVSKEIEKDQVLDLSTIERFYQLRLMKFSSVSGTADAYELIDNLAVFHDKGIAEIFYYRYPEEITSKTTDEYEFELSSDVLGIMPYGVAGDLLKSDISANYGQVYSKRYEDMLQRLDPRHATGTVYIEGGVDV